MSHLNSKIEDAITRNLGDPWLPDLTKALVEREWHMLGANSGIMAGTYSSARIIEGSSSGSREVIGLLPVIETPGIPVEPILIESLPTQLRPYFENLGLAFSSDTVVRQTLAHGSIGCAFQVIGVVPSLLRTIAQLVRVMHFLDVENGEFDVSFSDPRIPFSIFVSIPPFDLPNASFRLAEAIIHEAMHLQLTLIESQVPMVRAQEDTFFSPWKNNERSASGILHALYVFTVIYEWLQKLPQATNPYLLSRLVQIRNQVDEIRGTPFAMALSPAGQKFLRQLFAYFDSAIRI